MAAVFWGLASYSALGFGWDRSGAVIEDVPLGPTTSHAYGLSLTATLNYHYAAVNSPLSSNELGILKEHRPFNNLATDNDVTTVFVNIRRDVLDTINGLRYESPRRADLLLQAYNNRRISLAFGGGREDGVGFRGDGDVAINLYDFPCDPGPLKLYEPDMIRLGLNLNRAASYALKKGYYGPEPVTAQLEALWALTNQCREIWALCDDIELMKECAYVLESITNNLRLPSDACGFAAFMGALLLSDTSLTDADKRAKALKGLRLINNSWLPEAEAELGWRKFYKQGLQYYLSGDISSFFAYNDPFKKVGVFYCSRYFKSNEFTRVTTVGGGAFLTALPSPKIVGYSNVTQYATRADGSTASATLTIPLTYVSDGMLRGNNLYIAGSDETTAQGVILGYRGTSGNGFFDPGSGRELFRSSDLYGGLKLGWNPYDKTLMAFNRYSGDVFEFNGMDADGFPTNKIAKGTVSLRNDLMDFRISRDGNWAFGSPDTLKLTAAYSYTSISFLNPSNSLFQNYRIGDDFSETEVSPALASVPHDGGNQLWATTTPGWTCNVYRWDGAMKTSLGTATADPAGHMIFNLSDMLHAGDRFYIGNVNYSVQSPTYTVPAPARAQLFPPRISSGGKVHIQAYGQDWSPHTFQCSPNLTDWIDDKAVYTTGFGNTFLRSSLNTTMFWRTREDAKPLTGTPDYYKVDVGSQGTFYPTFNDRTRSGATYQLTYAPNVPTSHFNFNPNGTFSYVGASFDFGFNFQYQYYQGGETSAPITVVLGVTYANLNNPPAYSSNGVDYVSVPCLKVGGQHYPMYQFEVANNPADVCPDPHWHTPYATVYPLESPSVGIPDPNPHECGFGKVPEVPREDYVVTLDNFNSFKVLHFPPFSF